DDRFAKRLASRFQPVAASGVPGMVGKRDESLAHDERVDAVDALPPFEVMRDPRGVDGLERGISHSLVQRHQVASIADEVRDGERRKSVIIVVTADTYEAALVRRDA